MSAVRYMCYGFRFNINTIKLKGDQIFCEKLWENVLRLIKSTSHVIDPIFSGEICPKRICIQTKLDNCSHNLANMLCDDNQIQNVDDTIAIDIDPRIAGFLSANMLCDHYQIQHIHNAIDVDIG